MTTMISGVRSTNTVNAQQRKIDMADKLYRVEPNKSPLIVLLSRLKKRVAINPKFEWLEKRAAPKWDAINDAGGYDDDDTDLIVDNPSYFKAGDLVKVPRTGETMLVTVVTVGTSTLTVTRSWGTVAGAAIVDDDPLFIIGSVNLEGAGKPAIKMVKADNAFNYCQIIRVPFGATDTDANSEMFGGKSMAELGFDAAIECNKQGELSFWFGEKREELGGENPVRSTGGVLEFIVDNVKAVDGTLSETEFEDFCRMLFAKGSDTKFLFASPLVNSCISTWGRGKLVTKPIDKTYGINITEYISPHGKLNIIEHKLFEGDIYGGMAVGLDLENLEYRFLQNRDVHLKTDIQANDEDSQINEYIGEIGLQLALQETHAVMKGVTGPA